MMMLAFLLSVLTLGSAESVRDVPDDGYALIDLSADRTWSVRAELPKEGWSRSDRTDRLVLRKIRPGSFLSDGRKVTLTHATLVGVFPVTQRQYELVMGSNPSCWRGAARPVENVSWDDVNASDGFLARLRMRTGLQFDLPTEAEWEYACRAGSVTHFCGGETKDVLRRLGRFAENRDDGRGGFSEHATVGSYAPNSWGLYDMHGNVWEWCRDWYGAYEVDSLIDPCGARVGTSRVVRGGHWGDDWYFCGSGYRDDVVPDSRQDCLGFRVVVRLSSERPLTDAPAACRRWAEERTVARTFVSSIGTRLDYRLYEPSGITPGRKIPLVVFLHGAGERGGDNVRQLVHGVPQILSYSERMGEPCCLIAAQVPRAALKDDPQGMKWVSVPWDSESHVLPAEPSVPMTALIELVDSFRRREIIDTGRVYATGVSMGGYGTCDLAMRHPDWFAAIVPICGGADTNEAYRLRDVPVRLFHGSADTSVPPSRSRTMSAVLKAVGCDVVYREYPGVGHDCWTQTYSDDSVLAWLFRQRKEGMASVSGCDVLSKGVTIPVWPEGKIPSYQPATSSVRYSAAGSLLLENVCKSELVWFAVRGETERPAVIVCPGGGYDVLAYAHEGTEVAEWLNARGVVAFVLKYRCPRQRESALADAQRALSLVRSRAGELGVDPGRLGVMGFSAGANLSVRLSTNWRKRAYDLVDAVDRISCRPDFTVAVYPWMLVWGDHSDRPASLPLTLRGEFPVDAETPPAFIVQSQDDPARVENAVAYGTALKYAGVRSELHVFSDGGHGYGLRKQGRSTDGWENLLAAWMAREIGWVSKFTEESNECK